jgi:hypothetical protein
MEFDKWMVAIVVGYGSADHINFIKKAIAEWRSEKPGAMSYATGVVAMPVVSLVRQTVPKAAISGTLTVCDRMAKISTNQSALDPDDITACDKNAESAGAKSYNRPRG